MGEDKDLRIDKYLWAVRVYKTRTLASEACGKGQVSIGGVNVKSSRVVRVGDEIWVRKPPIVRIYKVLSLLTNRGSAEAVKSYVQELTPDEEFKKLEEMRLQRSGVRDRGTGRPTKKDRRDIDRLFDDDDDEI